MSLINIDFTYILKLNAIFNLKTNNFSKIESKSMSKKFSDIYDQSLQNPEKFWQEASNDIFWFKKPTKILNKSNPPFYKWFEDGVTNTCYNALDFHIDNGRGDRIALIYDSPITGKKNNFAYSVIFKIHKDLTVNQYLSEHGSSSFSRVLIYDKDADDIIGFVHKNDIMLAYHRLGTDYKISKLVKPIYTVPSTQNVSSLLQTLLTKRTHICLVIDEYGDVQGIVTLEDMIEALMGLEIVDERDQSTNMRAVAKQRWHQRLADSEHIVSADDNEPR